MNFHYSSEELYDAIKNTGVQQGDLLLCHSNVGFWGRLKDADTTNDTLNKILTVVLGILGPQGTLVVPTFTYSFGKNELYDPEHSMSNCGLFAEFVRKHPFAIRSLDPSVSVAAIGHDKLSLTTNLPENAYSENSFFQRFYERGGKILNFNLDAGTTLLHFAERELRVPYRFDKTFKGQIKVKDDIINAKSILWVRKLSPGTEANFTIFHKEAVCANLYKMVKVGRGFVGSISATSAFDLFNQLYKKDHYFLTNKGVKKYG